LAPASTLRRAQIFKPGDCFAIHGGDGVTTGLRLLPINLDDLIAAAQSCRSAAVLPLTFATRLPLPPQRTG